MRQNPRTRMPEYRAWAAMKSRCSNPKEKCSAYYLGRGITVCEEWKASFSAFLEHIGPRPSAKHSLDRIDNDGHYEPGNVRWVTQREQLLNRRGTRMVEVGGQSMALSDYARVSGIRYGTLLERLKHGVPLDMPVAKRL